MGPARGGKESIASSSLAGDPRPVRPARSMGSALLVKCCSKYHCASLVLMSMYCIVSNSADVASVVQIPVVNSMCVYIIHSAVSIHLYLL